MEERTSFLNITKRKALFLLVLVFAWMGLARAGNDALNIFQDSDQDGLSNQEELAYGTDPQNVDTDGDGYSDGAEVQSGYNPLKAAPGDKLVVEEQAKVAGQSDESEAEQENLTDLFVEKIKEEKGAELDVLQNLSENPEQLADADKIDQLSNISITQEDIEKILQESLDAGSSSDPLELLDESEIIVLKKPTGKNEEEIKEKEKKQIEEYFTALGYVALANSSIEVEDETQVDVMAIGLVSKISQYIQEGNIEEIKKLQEEAKNTYEEMKKVSTPEVLKQIHLTGLSVFNYILEIDPDGMINTNDPLSQVLALGKIQAAIAKLQDLESQVSAILDEYDISSFFPDGYDQATDDSSDESDQDSAQGN
jgi:hypothetical protein